MQKHLLYINLLAITSALAFGACADEVENTVSPEVEVGEKTPIELSVGINSSPLTRAVVIDGQGKITAFEKDTRLHFLMISEDASSSDRTKDKYTETYGMAKGSGKSVSQLDPDKDKWAATERESAISFASGNGVYRYWDDAHGRSSKLSVYGFANVWAINPTGAPWYPKLDRTTLDPKDNGIETKDFPAVWKSNPDDKIGTMVGATGGKWVVGDYTPNNNKNYKAQTKSSVLEKDDICYSNNLADYSSKGSNPELDKRLHFDATTKHFTGDVMVFHRAMCLFTFNVYMGRGFTEDQFTFKEGTNIAMKGFNKKGYLDIKNGKWTEIEVGNDASYEGVEGYSWSMIDLTNEDKSNKSLDVDSKGKYWQLLAFAIPGTDLKNSGVKDALTMIVNGNKYIVSMKQLYEALKDKGSDIFDKNESNESVCLKAGINYEFSFTLGKTAIDKITAQVVDWNTVEAANQDLSNARVTIDIEDDRDVATAPDYAFYRLEDNVSTIPDDANTVANYKWRSGYKTDTDHKSDLKYNTTTSSWSLSQNWYWPNSLTYYHFRVVQPSEAEIATDATDESKKFDYFTITSTEDNTYDPRWGAPFKEITDEADKLIYNKDTGFDVNRNYGTTITDNPHQIYKAIGATAQPIKLIPIHMMSNVTFKVTTTDGDDKVDLVTGEDKTTLELLNYYPKGRVHLGDGLVTTNGSPETYTFISQVSAPTATSPATYYYSVVPQDLANVEVRITTPDHNRYLIPLKDIIYTSTTSKELVDPYGVDKKINRWYPNYKYTYSFKLAKTGIIDLKATIVGWEEIEAEEEIVKIQ